MHRSLRPSNVEIRADDHTLTGHAGLLLTGELAGRTDLVARLDRAIDSVRPFKQRRRGSGGGELLVALAEMMAVGGDHRGAPGRAARGRCRSRAASGGRGAGCDRGGPAEGAVGGAAVA